MAQKFDSLEDWKKAYEQMLSFGIEPNEAFMAEKVRLEALEQVNPDEYVFGTLAAHNPFMTEEKEKVVREMTDQLLSNDTNAAQPCLLLGKVQCGKTDTFISIMGLCFDKGIDIAVVLTKGTNTLANQTISRFKSKKKGFGRFLDNRTYDQKTVITIYDILDLYKRGGLSEYQLSDPKNKFIIVCKKENTNLTDLNEMFLNNPTLHGKKVLVCDDEADFASRAYYRRKNETSLLKIAEHIENFIKIPDYCRYLQITATPSSLYLQPDGTVQLRGGAEASPWLPRYTGLVPIHGKYIGGQQYYIESENENSMYSCLYEPVSEMCVDLLSARNEWYLESNIYSDNLKDLSYAIVSYLFAAAVRSIQVRKKTNEKYYSSGLIHCDVAQNKHEWQADIITEIIEGIKKAFIEKRNTDLHILDFESKAYDSLKKSNELANNQGLINEKFPTYAEIEAEVKHILERNDYTINVVNSEEPGKVATMIDDNPDSPNYGQLRLEQTVNFFIGGSILDRGITIGNMLCFFYGRDPKKFQMDTVLQHARMYGARDKEDMACTRFFTTQAIYDVLKTINNFDDCMYEYLKAHRGTVQSNDFTSMVIGFDKRINPSAQNKYTPSNTHVIKKQQRIYPTGLQTGTQDEIKDSIQEIEDIIRACPGFTDVTEDSPFFLMNYESVVKIIKLCKSTFRYEEQYNNVEFDWDPNDMLTTLEYLTFNTDGYVWARYNPGHDFAREREDIYDKRGRFVNVPEDGPTISSNKMQATDRVVFSLVKNFGHIEQGWNGAEFFWPILMTPESTNEGIFTINANKKFKKAKEQHKLSTIDNYPPEEILHLTCPRGEFFAIINGEKKLEWRDIKTNNAAVYLAKDFLGKYILVEGTDPEKYYDLSTYNNGVFPYEIKEFKYIHLRTSMDLSGSQALLTIDEIDPYELMCNRYTQEDIHYDSSNVGTDAQDDSAGDWVIGYNIDTILEQWMTIQDTQLFQQYLIDLQNQQDEEEGEE